MRSGIDSMKISQIDRYDDYNAILELSAIMVITVIHIF